MHFQDSLLCKWKQGEKRNCPYHGTCDNQRNYRTVQLQAERYQGYVFSLNIHKSVIFLPITPKIHFCVKAFLSHVLTFALRKIHNIKSYEKENDYYSLVHVSYTHLRAHET